MFECQSLLCIIHTYDYVYVYEYDYEVGSFRVIKGGFNFTSDRTFWRTTDDVKSVWTDGRNVYEFTRKSQLYLYVCLSSYTQSTILMFKCALHVIYR